MNYKIYWMDDSGNIHDPRDNVVQNCQDLESFYSFKIVQILQRASNTPHYTEYKYLALVEVN